MFHLVSCACRIVSGVVGVAYVHCWIINRSVSDLIHSLMTALDVLIVIGTVELG